MGVTNYLLSGMILQVGLPGESHPEACIWSIWPHSQYIGIHETCRIYHGNINLNGKYMPYQKGSWLTETENGFMEPKYSAEVIYITPQSLSENVTGYTQVDWMGNQKR